MMPIPDEEVCAPDMLRLSLILVFPPPPFFLLSPVVLLSLLLFPSTEDEDIALLA